MIKSNNLFRQARQRRALITSALSNAYRREEEHNRARNIQKKRRFAAANRRLPVNFKALIRRRSRLAVMHANNDPLGVRFCLPFCGADPEGRPLEVRQSPNRLSSSGRAWIVATTSRKCLEVMAALWKNLLSVAGAPQKSRRDTVRATCQPTKFV